MREEHAAFVEVPWVVSIQTMVRGEMTHIGEGTIVCRKYLLFSLLLHL